MCIMEMHEHQRPATLVQALAHNTSTILTDIGFLEQIAGAHPGTDYQMDSVERAKALLKQAEAALLGAFGIAVGAEVQDAEGHVHMHDHPDGPHGNERTLVEQAVRDSRNAKPFETR